MPSKTPRNRKSASAFLPKVKTLPALQKAAGDCQGCDLYRRATQTVFGEGSPRAALLFVGEQPGDMEDRAGHPFVGPAGNLLHKALNEAKIPRQEVYVTNAVKHFKWEPLGKKRKHKRPSPSEVAACQPWLVAEISAVSPVIVVCLGVIAAESVLGRAVRLIDEGGKFHQSEFGPLAFVTIHPSLVLRQPEKKDREAQYARLLHDFKEIRKKLLTLRIEGARKPATTD